MCDRLQPHGRAPLGTASFRGEPSAGYEPRSLVFACTRGERLVVHFTTEYARQSPMWLAQDRRGSKRMCRLLLILAILFVAPLAKAQGVDPLAIMQGLLRQHLQGTSSIGRTSECSLRLNGSIFKSNSGIGGSRMPKSWENWHVIVEVESHRAAPRHLRDFFR